MGVKHLDRCRWHGSDHLSRLGECDYKCSRDYKCRQCTGFAQGKLLIVPLADMGLEGPRMAQERRGGRGARSRYG
jgi:hypothetical protein